MTIHEFRGVRRLQLDLKGKNFAVCGPNGTGKSGIVDALEFVLTGTISRLTGQGRGDLSIKDHAPHVDSRFSPDKAYVEAVVSTPANKKTFTIRRTVKSPKTLSVIPDTKEARALFKSVEEHPEIALSRREIIRYVLAEPGKRSKDVQALLKLDQLEDLRTKFQRIANAEQTSSANADRVKEASKNALLRALGLATLSSTEVLTVVNHFRAVLGLEPLTVLSAEVSLKDGLASAPEGEAGHRLVKAAAKADVEAARSVAKRLGAEEFVAKVAAASQAVTGLQADASLLDAVVRDDFLRTALDLYDGEACPACETPKAPEVFAAIIEAKRAKLAEVHRLRTAAETLIAPLIEALEAETQALRTVFPLTKRLLDDAALKALTNRGAGLKALSDQLAAFVPLDATLAALEAILRDDGLNEVFDRLDHAIAVLPEPSEQEAARDFLTVADLRFEALRSDNAAARSAAARAQRARKVLDVYAEASRLALEKVYQDVEGHFAELYRHINADDESTFEAKLMPSMGKLGFNVDFYTRGFFPPGAYHSEGHQDSMGLCLYLALMRHLLGDAFTFAVLDDVLMSVDAGHRREVSRMLKAEFPNTQFVLTTHDKTWLKHMGTAGLVEPKQAVHFRKWTVDEGPSAWTGGDIWAEIREYATLDDVRGAAALLRHYLEHLAGEYCQSLRVRVEYRADGRHDLGDLLAPAIGQMKKLLLESLAAAESWGDTVRADAIRQRTAALTEAAAATSIEQWQVNPAIHFNAWSNFHKNDFLPLVDSFEALVREFTCQLCGDLLEVSPHRGSKEHMLCLCGGSTFSFKKKTKEKTAG
nr:AAA family ATPase [Caulobacter sp. 17J80-11]